MESHSYLKSGVVASNRTATQSNGRISAFLAPFLAPFLCALVLTGCGGGSSNAPVVPEVATTKIGAAGGTITTPVGMASITIPAGALATEQEITIELLNADETPDPYSSTGEMSVGGVGIKLLPEGLVFAAPIEITLVLPDSSAAAAVDSITGFSLPLSVAALISADGSKEALTNPVVSLDPDTGEVSLTAQISHFSEISWVPYRDGDGLAPATVDVFGYQDTLAVGANIALIAKARYEPGIVEQLQIDLTDQSVAPFNLISGAGTFPLLHEAPQVGAYTCAEVGSGTYQARVSVTVNSTTTATDPFVYPFDPNAPKVPAILFNGDNVPVSGLIKDYTISKPVECIAEVSDGGAGTDDGGTDSDSGNVNAGSPISNGIESFVVVASATEVFVGQTFTVTTQVEVNSLFTSSDGEFQVSTIWSNSGLLSPATFVEVNPIIGTGVHDSFIVQFFRSTITSGTTFVQEWVFKCTKVGTFEDDFEFILASASDNGRKFDQQYSNNGEAYVDCIAAADTGTTITGTPDTTQILNTTGAHTFEIDASSLGGFPGVVELFIDIFIHLESFFAQFPALVSSQSTPTFKKVALAASSGALTIADIGTPTANGISFDSLPTDPFEVVAVVGCDAEGVATLTANLTDNSGAVLATDSIQITCEQPPVGAACTNATTGIEMAFECNVGSLAFTDIFQATIVDVPIGGGAGQTVPGGATLHLPLANSGDVPNEANFAASGWDGTISPPATPVPTLLGLDANHQYLFVQYENGVDLIDLSTPGAAPVYTGLLDFPGREQVAEFFVDDRHDYMVMPVHGATQDYLIGCGVDVVKHVFEPTANSGAGGFAAQGELISDGFELCRDIWTDVNGSGVAPGYAYTTKTISNSQKTTKWLEDGIAEVTLGGDWSTQGSVGLDDSNRILSGVGGFFGKNTLLASRGNGELGLWYGPTGDAPVSSITRVSNAAFFEDLRCVGALCVATSPSSLTTLLWPDRAIVPSVHQTSAIFSSENARSMVAAANGNVYQLAVTGSGSLSIGQVSPAGDINGTRVINISNVCTDPKQALIIDMNHVGILCRNDNLFKVLEFAP